MSAHIELLENGRVIYFRFAEPWNIHELKDVINQANVYLDNATEKLHMISNVRALRSVPPQIFTVSDTPILKHRNNGQFAIVGAPSIVKALAEAIFRITMFKKATFCKTEDEAWNYIRGVIAAEQAAPAEGLTNMGVEPA